MGYDVTIEREDGIITCEEWVRVVDEEEEMCLGGIAQIKLPSGQVLSMPEIEMAIWKPEGKPAVHISFGKGMITVKNPDERAIRKMKQLAQKLDAKVVGDEGEKY